jgi:hypothetical protein
MPRTHKDPQWVRPLTPAVEAEYLAEEASLTEAERADMEALHAGLADGTIVSVMTPQEKARIEAIARRSPKVYGASLDDNPMRPAEERADRDARLPSKRITVRITLDDLQTLQQKAREQGLPYQTLLKSVVHQYLTGQLVPRA